MKPDLSGGGAIMDHTVHVVDLLRYDQVVITQPALTKVQEVLKS